METQETAINENYRWLSARKAAAYIDMNIKTFRNYVARGLLPYHQNSLTGTKRFRADELDQWLTGGAK